MLAGQNTDVGRIQVTRFGDVAISCDFSPCGPSNGIGNQVIIKVYVNVLLRFSLTYANPVKGSNLTFTNIITGLQPHNVITVNLAAAAYSGCWDATLIRTGIGIYSDNAHIETIDGVQI